MKAHGAAAPGDTPLSTTRRPLRAVPRVTAMRRQPTLSPGLERAFAILRHAALRAASRRAVAVLSTL